MTQEELSKIPFKCVGHLAMEHEHCVMYVSEDGRLGICDHTPRKGFRSYGKTYRHYSIDGKVYKTKEKFLEALKDFKPNSKIIPLWSK